MARLGFTDDRMNAMLRAAFCVVPLCAMCCSLASAAGIDVQSRLDKERHLAGEPVYLIIQYTNNGNAVEVLNSPGPYCVEPTLEPTSLRRAVPPVCPDFGFGAANCSSVLRRLRPGETYAAKYLLNSRFDLNEPGTYTLTVSEGAIGEPSWSAKTVSLVLDRASEQELRAVYQPYFAALDSWGSDRAEAVRVLAGAGASFTQDALLQASLDPRNDLYVQSVADLGLVRLRTRVACARLAELAVLHRQQQAIVALGQCGDPGYMQLLFNLAATEDHAPATNAFALAAAAEAGGEAAVDRLLNMMLLPDREAVFLALGRTGSPRAAKAIIDALPSVTVDTTQYVALAALTTLTHRQSKQPNFAARAKEWKDWWTSEGTKQTFGPRDCRGGISPLR